MSVTLLNITVGLYALASIAAIAHAMIRGDRSRELARVFLATALVSHVASIGTSCSSGLHPLVGTSGVLSLVGFLVAGSLFASSFRWQVGLLGGFVTPLAFGLAIASKLTATHVAPPDTSAAFLKRIHLTLVALGVAAFLLAAGVAVMYLLQNRALKSGSLLGVGKRGPALNTLDTFGRRLVMFGFPVFTLAIVTGVVWFLRLGAMSFRVEYIIAGGVWLMFATLILGRFTVGLRGRSAALLTLAGFGATTVVLLIYVARRVMS